MLSVTATILLFSTVTAPPTATEPPITNVAELVKIVNSNASEGRIFDLTAIVVRDTPVVTSSLDSKEFHITDGTKTAAVALHKLPHDINLNAGDRVHVTGFIKHPRHMRAQAHTRTVSVLSHDTPPQPLPCLAADIAAGRHDGQFVRVEGTVIDTYYDDIDSRFSFFVIADGSTILYAPLNARPPLAELRALIGARIAVIGTCGLSTASRPYLTREINMTHRDDFTVLVPPPADPFAVPELFSDAAPTLPGYGRRHVYGRVLAVWGKNHVLLRARNEKAVRVTLAHGSLPMPGDCIEAVGQPDTDIFSLNLTQALWRKGAKTSIYEPPVQTVTTRSLLYDAAGQRRVAFLLHGQSIRLHGKIRGIVEAFDGRMALIEDDNVITHLHEGSAKGVFDGLAVGSMVEATGTCVLETEPFRPQTPSPRAKGVFVVLRTPDDLNILARPPWWTPARLLVALAVMFLGSLAVIIWNRLLTHRVETRSRELLDEQIAHVTSDLKTMERTRLAIELHDAISQNLTGVALELQTTKDVLRENTDQAAQHLDIANRSLMSCREELRNCLRDLRSDALDLKDVNEAIRLTLAPHVGGASVTIRFNVPRERISDNTMHALLRIIRELVANAVRHGHATAVKVAGAIEDGKLLFSVADNGCGFDPDNRPGIREGHYGLQGIHERIGSFGGTMTIDSAVGHGTKATLALQLPQEDNA